MVFYIFPPKLNKHDNGIRIGVCDQSCFVSREYVESLIVLDHKKFYDRTRDTLIWLPKYKISFIKIPIPNNKVLHFKLRIGHPIVRYVLYISLVQFNEKIHTMFIEKRYMIQILDDILKKGGKIQYPVVSYYLNYLNIFRVIDGTNIPSITIAPKFYENYFILPGYTLVIVNFDQFCDWIKKGLVKCNFVKFLHICEKE